MYNLLRLATECVAAAVQGGNSPVKQLAGTSELFYQLLAITECD